MLILPKSIYLAALKERFKIAYVRAPGKLMLVELPRRRLVVYGKRYAKRDAIKLLIKWTKRKSKNYLISLLTKLNRKIKAKLNKIRIHGLQTEWGSCSSERQISLNYKLIFLPPTLVHHLIIHELCHLRYLNHSPKFWKEVAKYDKNWNKNKVLLYTGDIHIPRWVIF